MHRILARSAAAYGSWLQAHRLTGSAVACPPPFFSARRWQGRAAAQEAPQYHHTTCTAAAATDSSASDEETGSSIYSRPDIYDAAFSFRDFNAEVSFLLAAYKKYGAAKKPATALELGCGPARHAIGLAKKGLAVTALDANEGMLAYAAGAAKAAGAPLTTVLGDMRTFDFGGKQFDLIVCLLGTFSHMQENRDALATLQRIAAHLAPGGLFVLELAHPGDLFDGTLIVGDGGAETWEVAAPPAGSGRKLLVQWGSEVDDFDPVSQVVNRSVTITTFEGEAGVESLEEVVPYRQFTVQELHLLGDASGLEVKGLYGEMAMGVDLYHEEAYRMVACMQRKA